MAVIAYLDSFPATNAIDIIEAHGRHELLKIDSDDPIDLSLERLTRAHAYQCVGARDEVPEQLRVDTSFLRNAKNLLVVSSSGSGVDVFDIEACTKAGVLAVNQAGANAQSVAEHVVSMMIDVLKNISRSDRALRAGWQGKRSEFRGRDLFGRCVGIVGLGNIGTRVADICQAGFKCKVLAYDPYLTENEVCDRHALAVSFDELLARSDIITVHTPLTDETRRLFDRRAFACMQSGAVFISAARGSIHDEQALAESLESGHLYGAGLDVWESEPPLPSHRLLRLDNVVASPHVAGSTIDSLQRMAEYAATQLLTLFDGHPPPRPVNAGVMTRYAQRYQQILG